MNSISTKVIDFQFQLSDNGTLCLLLVIIRGGLVLQAILCLIFCPPNLHIYLHEEGRAFIHPLAIITVTHHN